MVRMADTNFPLSLSQRAAGLLCGLVLLTACGLGLAQTPADAAAAGAAADAAAPNGAAAPLTKGEIKARRDFQMLDFNKDGKLSRAEVALFPRLAAAFDTADTDKDGFVSFEEVEVFAVQYRAERAAAKAAEQEAGKK
ncbi:EF-hand domain-containing protein [Comamonas antarctica]